MKRLFFCIIFSVVCIGSVFSQFDAQLSQYMFHNSSFNPAAVGENNLIQITGQHRIQWVGFPNAGQTTVFSINSPLKLGNSENGIGFRFLNDRVGLFTNRSAQLQYAYKKRILGGLLSVGADIGFVSVGFHGDSVNVANHVINIGDYHKMTSDPSIPQTSVAGMGLDMSVGVFYSTPKYYGGLSFTHLNNPIVNLDDKSNFNLLRTAYLTGGGSYVLTNPLYVLKPSALLKTDFRSLQFDFSTRVEYDNKYWGGMSYRLQDAVVFLAGINLVGGLSVGYSFDLLTSKVITVSSGSHEIVLVYNFAYVSGKRTSKFKSIRLL
ncbi:MAG TPA: PorP/SprF family type IX secretion system membrane protein [Paludibacter sp.]|nr:PorP/SprF family type IX secretion system membrane protein [Paludibacter sp.]